MIKVIACDMDGTLLNDEHEMSKRTEKALMDACAQGIRIMISTGRNFQSAYKTLENNHLICDYITCSGAEIRDQNLELKMCNFMEYEKCKEIYEKLSHELVRILFCTREKDHYVGTREEMEQAHLEHLRAFHSTGSDEEILNSDIYKTFVNNTCVLSDMEEFKKQNIGITKLFVFSKDQAVVERAREIVSVDPTLAVASSAPKNIEITDWETQKGPVLQRYIESLGYRMEEVMAFGDSMNDYSMLSMDFGATVAMENAEPEVKKVSKYITKSNAEDGVAIMIEELLRSGSVPDSLRQEFPSC